MTLYIAEACTNTYLSQQFPSQSIVNYPPLVTKGLDPTSIKRGRSDGQRLFDQHLAGTNERPILTFTALHTARQALYASSLPLD